MLNKMLKRGHSISITLTKIMKLLYQKYYVHDRHKLDGDP